jgi:chemotaxis protein histidine kinase CheA
MTRRSSSQVGLFAAQISEQIQRLRPLAAPQGGPGEMQQVDLRRAIMATRMLGGSARILGLEALHVFLDELLDWLQRIEQARSGLTTSQGLILESVIELEDSLFQRFEHAEKGVPELGEFFTQIDDLTGLIRRDAASMDPRERKPGSKPLRAAVPEGPLARLRAKVEAATSPEEHAQVLAEIEKLIEDLSTLAKTLHQRLSEPTDAEVWDYPVEGLAPHQDPAGDPVVGPAVARLRNATTELGCTLEVVAYGSASTLMQPLRGPVSEILSALVQDVAAAAATEPDLTRLKVVFEMREDQGRVRIHVADNGPRSGNGNTVSDTDHLSMLMGLRRARNVLDQVGGLIRVEPRENPAVRFEVVVPLDPARPGYIVLPIEGSQVAVPAALYERTVRAGGLLYETDEGGESVQLHGRSVPVVELGDYVPEIVPSRGSSPFLVVTGAVEKRMGMTCEKPPVIVRTSSLGDPPRGWEHVAYGSILVEGDVVPVLDVRRLLEVRFRTLANVGDVPGTVQDPAVDAWEPTRDPVSQRVAPLSGMIAPVSLPTVMRALLVNQSQFRRRELRRTLESLGMDVEVCEDLPAARDLLQRNDFDLLVTDLRLGTDHTVSFPELKKVRPGLQVVLTSSVAREYADDLAARTGADRCWLDPYRASDLGVMLEALRQV